MARRLLPLVLLLAVGVRLWGITFGLPFAYARPDETEVAGPAVTYLSGNLEPLFFQWPSLFSYLVAVLYAVYGGLMGPITGYASIADFANSRYQSIVPFLLISRGLSVAMGTATVWLTYRMARRFFDEEVAIVSALFLALSFLHVRDSHFGMTDITMTALVVMAVLAALRFHETGSASRAAVAGLLAGLAGSTKYNGLASGVTFAAAIAMRLAQSSSPSSDLPRLTRASLAFAAAAAVGFFGASPYILIDWPRFLGDVQGLRDTMAAGHGGIIVGRGWWYFGRVVMPAAVGWPVWIAAVAATAALLTGSWRRSAVLLAFPIAYYVVAGRSFSVFARYILPIVPFACMIGAWFACESVRALVRWMRWPSAVRGPATAAVAIAVIAPAARQTITLDQLLATSDNRLVAARALATVLPADSVIYQSGSSYGRVPLGIGGVGADLQQTGFDEDTGRFGPVEPGWVIIQRSPLLTYSRVPPSLERVLAEQFTLVARFQTETGSAANAVYDQQDAFYLPLSGLGGVRRPGPAFELYKRRVRDGPAR